MKKLFLIVGLFISSLTYSQKYFSDTTYFLKDSLRTFSVSEDSLIFYIKGDTAFLSINKAVLYVHKFILKKEMSANGDFAEVFEAIIYKSKKKVTLGLYFKEDYDLEAVALTKDGFTTIFKIRKPVLTKNISYSENNFVY